MQCWGALLVHICQYHRRMDVPPEMVREATGHLIKGGFRLLGNAVQGHYRRKQAESEVDLDRLQRLGTGAVWEPSPLPEELSTFRPSRARALPALDPLEAPAGMPRVGLGDLEDLRELDGDPLMPAGAARSTDDDPAPARVPGDLFSPVIGHDYEKRLLRRAIASEKPAILHVLIEGPPGGAKSLLLDECARTPGAVYVAGSTITSSGLVALFLDGEQEPRLLLFDEIDKAEQKTRDTLLTITDQKATRVVGNKEPVVRDIDVRVIAVCNSRAPLSPALLSRFQVLRLSDQTQQQRREVIEHFLRDRGTPPLVAIEIASTVAAAGQDTREAARIAGVYASDPDLAKEMLVRLRSGTQTAKSPRDKG